MKILSLVKTMTVPAALLSVALAMPAKATVYVVNLSGGGGTATGTISTDGTIGALSVANITGWSLDLTSGANDAAIKSSGASRVRMFGSGLTATSAGLFFDFSATNYAIFELWPSVGTLNFLCFTGGVNCGGATNQISIGASNEVSTVAKTGVQQIAAVASVASVPEPASWALMIGGLGLVGMSMRRRTFAVSFA